MNEGLEVMRINGEVWVRAKDNPMKVFVISPSHAANLAEIEDALRQVLDFFDLGEKEYCGTDKVICPHCDHRFKIADGIPW